jgi:predicted  nucleic acid-binding Zn-ribbon protein
MKISHRKKGNPKTPKEQCPECGDEYLQTVYMFYDKKWNKIGMGCPKCLPKTLKQKSREPPKIRLVGCTDQRALYRMVLCRYCKYRDARSEKENNVCGIFDKHEIIRVFNES